MDLSRYFKSLVLLGFFLAASPLVVLDEHTAEEGSYITLTCTAQSSPHPQIIWRKENDVIDVSQPRYRILSDGSLQIVGLHKSDSGTYNCIANNGIGSSARKDIRLVVTEPAPLMARNLGDDDVHVVATLGAPYYLRCFACGWPRPAVTWWRGDAMLPLSSTTYEQTPDYTLQIRAVAVSTLGEYTCQAYNGLGEAASKSLTVQALGPVNTTSPEDDAYTQFLISPVDESTTVSTRYLVPVRTNITLDQNEFTIGDEISIPCDVDGHPKPRVLWFKDGQLIEQSETVQISESHRLTISQANSSDSGLYVCEAENGYSFGSSDANIRVEGIYIHPNCTDNPLFENCGLIVQANYCPHKYYARFCCKSCTEDGQLPSFGPHLMPIKEG